MDDELALTIAQHISEELKTLAPINPNNFIISYREIVSNEQGVVYNIYMHQLATRRRDKIVIIQASKWFMSMLDMRTWRSTFGRAATILLIRDVVDSIRRHIKTAKPLTMN